MEDICLVPKVELDMKVVIISLCLSLGGKFFFPFSSEGLYLPLILTIV